MDDFIKIIKTMEIKKESNSIRENKTMEISDFLKEPDYGYHMLAKFAVEPDDEDRVMYVFLSEDKRVFTVVEACDDFYCVDLNKSQVLEWIEDLKKIADVMEE